MDDTPTCPPWWPQLLWGLHFHPRPWRGGGGPVNYPRIIEDIMASLHVDTLSYLMIDQEAAGQIRAVAEHRLASAADNLSAYHNEAAGKTLSVAAAASGVASGQATKGIDGAAVNMRALAEQGLAHAKATISQMRALAEQGLQRAAHGLPRHSAEYRRRNGEVARPYDQEAASQIRTVAEHRLVSAAGNLSAYHSEAAGKALSVAPAASRVASAQATKGIDEAAVRNMRALAEQGVAHTKATISQMRVLAEQGLQRAAHGLPRHSSRSSAGPSSRPSPRRASGSSS